MISGEGEEWSRKVSVFKAYQDAGSQSEVASRFAVTQGTVSNYTKEVKGMISKVIGGAHAIADRIVNRFMSLQ